MGDLRWPRTLFGWRRLFWLALRRCPVHRRALLRDPWFGDPGEQLYGFCCDGVSIWPRGLLRTLRSNRRAAHRSTEEETRR